MQADRRPVLVDEPPRPAPLLWPVIGLILGIWLSETWGPLSGMWRALTLLVPPASFGLLLVGPRGRARHVLSPLIVFGMALSVGVLRHQSATYRPPYHIVHALAAEPVLSRVVGRIVTTPIERPPVRLNPFLPFDPPPRTQLVLALDELRASQSPTRVAGNVRVTIEATGLNLRLGQRLQLSGRLYRPAGPRNPGETDWAAWHRYQGIDAGLIVEGAVHVLVLPDPEAWYYRLVAGLRDMARSLLFEPYADLDADPSVRLLDIMILGQRSTADQKLNEAFLRAGGLHFLAVSGFNVNVLAGTTWWLVRRVLRREQRFTAISTVTVIVLFALVTEPNAPILRAAAAGVAAALASMLRRPVCLTNSLALAAGFVLVLNPLELFRAGFQLSFVQVVGLITVVPAAYNWVFRRRTDEAPLPEPRTLLQMALRAAKRGLVGLTIVCILAWLVSVPLQLVHFGYFTPWGGLGTLLLTPLVTVATVLSLLTLLGNALLPPVGLLLGVLLHWVCDDVLWVVGLFAHVPGAVLPCHRLPAGLAMCTYLGGLALVACRPAPSAVPARARTTAIAKLGLLAAAVLGWLVWLARPTRAQHEPYRFWVLAVGNGSAMCLATADGHAAVFDVGTDTNSDAGEIVVGALRSAGVRRVDMALVSHANFDHYSGLPTLMRRLKVSSWFSNAYFTSGPDPGAARAPLLALLPPGTPPPGALHAGDRRTLGSAELEILWPPAEAAATLRENDTSLVVRLTAVGRSILLTGDIEQQAMSALLSAHQAGELNLRSDVLIAPHHGAILASRGITAGFYAAVAPKVVLVSTRRPRPKLGPLVTAAVGGDCRIVMTRDAGAIMVGVGADGRITLQTPYLPPASDAWESDE